MKRQMSTHVLYKQQMKAGGGENVDSNMFEIFHKHNTKIYTDSEDRLR